MLMLTQLAGFGGNRARVLTLAYIENPTYISGAPYTWSGVNIGTARADRRVVVTLGFEAATISSVTIGGVAATVDASSARSAVVSAIVPTGTTADVAVTFVSAPSRASIAVYTITGGAAPSSSFTDDSAPMSQTATAAIGEVVIATGYSTSGGVTDTWTGLDENHSLSLGSNQAQHSSASRKLTSANPTVALTFSSGTPSFCGAVYR